MTNKQFFQQCWKSEMQPTLIALKALTAPDKLGYRPAQRNRSAKELVDHFVSHVDDLVEAVEDGILNHRLNADFPTIQDAIDDFERGSEKLIALLDNVDDKTWNEKNIPMMVYGNKFGEHTLSGTCWMFLFDIIHHRGQLSTYYRPMGFVQPAIYGPTSEMVEAMMAQN
ncbi:MAG: DinB family protein [Ferruginibacter sp.]